MKRISISIAVAAVCVVANAQSFSDGFENAVFSQTDNTTGNHAGDTVTSVVTWAAVNNSQPLGGTGWFVNTGVFAAHAGTGEVNANYNNTGNIGTIDNYLMSPVRTFNNGDTISFWTRTVDAPAFPDRLYLKLSTAGASILPSSFTTTLVAVNPNLTTTGYPNVWTQYSVNISGLGGPTAGRFALNYNVPNAGFSGSNSDFIGIDDVVYNSVPEPVSMIALGAGALALLRRRKSA